jgi:transposase
MLSSHLYRSFIGNQRCNNKQDNIIDVWLELKREIHECPRCHDLTETIHDYRIHTVKGPPLGSRFVLLHYRKRRYVCTSCGKRFDEINSFVPRYHRMSSALVDYIIRELKNTHSLKSISEHCNVSSFTVARLFDYIAPLSAKLPEVLSIDEFKGNTLAGKYQCILTDPKNHRVLDILPGREMHHLSSYFSSFSKEERAKVKVVVTDMWQAYQDMARTYFKNAILVIDRFHYIRQVFWVFDKVRKEEQKRFLKSAASILNAAKNYYGLVSRISPKRTSKPSK